MISIGVYIGCFLFLFAMLTTICFCVRVENKTLSKICPPRNRYRNRNRRIQRQRLAEERNRCRREAARQFANRQGNIYTISDDNAINAGPPRFADFFYLEPGSEEAARIRAQLEKDDKELPSYDEVMRMTSLPQDPIAMESGTAAMGASNTSIATTTTTIATDISIPAPPYTEVDPNATITAATVAATSSAIAGTPSTSRAAASGVVVNIIPATTATNA